ncbi:hypothetical protein EXU48_12715 [Occultella glacieicola]|uniref:ATPase BadF/BadG/BcrA/BcrD type domain-containing protein n=1 Tax=Occultella glacieicola TaxID=2518684 RepID=A0ABY2E7I9_9MICO|nr:BadF/BadG/BcrA/BcrD ATPase family protein [Occultella glacieicola]TDE94281.1 hypothetical protein EXU48_12715 [Occultella glacieicola]
MRVIVGADVGGTSSKVAVGLADGPVLSYATGPGGNIRSSPGSVRANLAQTLTAALAAAADRDRRVAALTARSGRPGGRGGSLAVVVGAGPVAAGAADGGRGLADADAAGIEVAGLVGMAGAGTGADPVPDALEAVRGAWADAGLPGEPWLRGDLAIAYAAAAQAPDGLLLLSGTGAVAARVQVPGSAIAGGDTWAGLEVAARCDGMGWILGDLGSGVWIGLAGLRAAAADLDGRGPATALTTAILDWAGVPGGPEARQGLIVAVHAMAPSQYGSVAPLVAGLAASGDRVASAIVDEAVTALVSAAQVVAGSAPSEAGPGSAGGGADPAGHPGPTGPDGAAPAPAEIVLAGSLLTTAGPVRDGVRAALTARFGLPQGVEVALRDAEVPVVGGLRLAAAEAGWPVGDPAVLADAVRAVAPRR